MSNKKITVKIVGGLGNQLFGYFAGLDVSNQKNADLVLDVSDIRGGLGAHNVSIESLNLIGEFTAKKVRHKFLLKFFNKFNRICSFFSLTKTNYYSNVIGFDPLVYKQNYKTILNGYFQTYIHFQNSSHLLGSLKLRNPSRLFQDKCAEISNGNSLVIHVRRGDYEKFAIDYGLLSRKYYAEAINRILSISQIDNTWIFSDDIDKAKLILDDLVPASATWVDPKDLPDDAEALILMSKARNFIIANSTFSWWAAMLSNSKGVVVAPEKWYRNMDDPNDLLPHEWCTIPSYWENN